MILEFIPRPGVAGGGLIRLQASQLVVLQDNGTPVAIAAEYGPANTVAVSMVGLEDFNRMLRRLGYDPVVCDRLLLPQPPPGARLLRGPIAGE